MSVNFNDNKNLLLSKINQEEVISLTKKLIKIPSVTGNEKQICDFLYNYLKKCGFVVSKEYVEDNRPNIIARFKKGEKGKTILLNGHLDTVPAGDNWSNDPFSATEDDCYIYGRGSADMKGGVAAQICAMRAFMESEIPFNGEIIFSGVVGEEVDQSGTISLVNNNILADCAIVSEPTNLLLVSSCKGDMDIRVQITGKAAHASVPEKGLNAIYLASKIVLELEKYANNLKKTTKHQILGTPTLVVGTIKGGEVPCMVAGSCELRVDRRLLPNEDIDKVVSEIKEVVNSINIKFPEFTSEIKVLYSVPAMECDGKLPLVVCLQKNINKLYKGGDSSIHGWPATTDGNVLNAADINTVIFGPGTIDVAHKPDERIEKNQLALASKIIAATIFDLFKVTG